jgi:hypothetical protein
MMLLEPLVAVAVALFQLVEHRTYLVVLHYKATQVKHHRTSDNGKDSEARLTSTPTVAVVAAAQRQPVVLYRPIKQVAQTLAVAQEEEPLALPELQTLAVAVAEEPTLSSLKTVDQAWQSSGIGVRNGALCKNREWSSYRGHRGG